MIPYSDAYEPGTFEDMLRRLPSIEKIESAISWQPQADLDTILSDVVHDLKQRQAEASVHAISQS